MGAALMGSDALVVDACLSALASLGTDAAPAAVGLGRTVAHSNPHLAARAAGLLQMLGSRSRAETPQLLKGLRHKYGMVVVACAKALQSLDPDSETAMCKSLCASLKSDNNAVVYNAGRALRVVGPQLSDPKVRNKTVMTLSDLVEGESKAVMAIAALALGSFGEGAAAAIPALKNAAMTAGNQEFAKAALKEIAPGLDVENLEPETDIEMDLNTDTDLGLDLDL